MAQQVIITGLRETLDALKKVDKDAAKRLTKTINKELQSAKQEAQTLAMQVSAGGAPLSNWKTTPHAPRPRNKNEARPFPVWDVGEVVSNISVSRAKGRTRGDYTTSAGAVINASAAGRVYELAGRGTRNRNANKRSQAFKQNLNAKFGEASRLVYRVVDRNRERIERNIFEAIEQAKKDLQKALESQQVK